MPACIIIIIKVLTDLSLLYYCSYKAKYKFNIVNYILLSILHPFYIVVFSTIAPFKKIKWK